MDQMKNEVISSNNLNAETIASQISASANKIDNLTALIKKKDGDIAALNKDLKQTHEKFQELSMKLSKAEADLRDAQEKLSKAPSKPAPEESKTQMIA
jgi:chromosome segregation ATPase